jgi:hypothetical protein
MKRYLPSHIYFPRCQKSGVYLKADAIVGIDAGVTTAVAILNIDNEVAKLKSSKDFSLDKILGFISAECSPLFIASDVSCPPKLLEKVAAAFSVGVTKPKVSIPRRVKSRLARRYDISDSDHHKEDALAAALSAYDSISPLLKKIETALIRKRLDGRLTKGQVARKIISGECNNIEDTIKSIMQMEGSENHGRNKIKRPRDFGEALSVKEKEIHTLQEIVRRLEEKNKSMETEIRELRRKDDVIRSEIEKKLEAKSAREIAAIKLALESVRNNAKKSMDDIENHRKIIRLATEGWLPALFVENCDKSLLAATEKKYGLQGKWVFIGSDRKTSGVEIAERSEGVFCTGALFDLMRKRGITALDYNVFDYFVAGDFAAINIERKNIEKIKSDQFFSWLEKYKNGEFRPCRLR